MIKENFIKLKTQPKWLVRTFVLMGAILGGIFAFVSYPIVETKAQQYDYGFDYGMFSDEYDYFGEEILYDEENPEKFNKENAGNITKGTDYNTENRPDTLTTFEKAFQEVAYAYYMRGPYLHYNASKSLSDILSPEESTSQDYHYMTCTPYVMNVYKELLGIVLTPVDYHYSDYARDYVGVRPEVVGYGEKIGANLYWWDGTTQYSESPQKVNPDQSYIISQLKIGDILYYAGHAMLVYDYVYSGNDIVDVYLLHSWQANYITKTKADHTAAEKYYNKSGEQTSLRLGNSPWSKLGYNYRDKIGVYEDSRIEGTVILQRLTEHSALSFTGTYKNYYSILRLVTTNSSGEDLLNFNGQWTGGDQNNTKKFNYYGFLGLGSGTSELYELDNTLKKFDNRIINYYSDSVESRLNYSKLYIEKIVDKKDNNIVESDDELTYTIKIQNSSKKTYTGDLIVTEYIDTNLVEYKRTSRSGVEINGNQLQWNIGKLSSGDEVIIEYTVRVKTGHIGETIEITGLVDNIPSGIIKNKIGKNTNKGEELKQSYNNLSGSYTGRILIDEIYKDSYGVDLGLDGFNMTGYISGDVIIQGQSGLILYNKKWNGGWNPNTHGEMYINPANIFSGMVLNSYFNFLRRVSYSAINGTKITLYEVPTLWSYKNIDNRANTIYPTDFKTGDILIYINENDVKYATGKNSSGDKINKEIPITYENGEYAYIYIDGKFVGVNLGKDGVKDQKTGGDDRNEFGTIDYHVDNRVDSYKRLTSFAGDYLEGSNGCSEPTFGSYCIKKPTDELKEFLRYQTLFGKDAYVVLRPSLMIRTINYELDGGTNSDDNPSAFILGRDIELGDPTRDDFLFKGWYTDPEYTMQVNNINELTDDVMLYAKWGSSNCEFNGNTINSGESVTGYESSIVPYGQTCKTEIRTCTNGELSGTYQYGSCTVGQPASCTFNGVTINNGESVTGYRTSTVSYGETCESEIITCTNGELSGLFTYSSCTVEDPESCTFNGNTINHGESVIGYKTSTVPYGQICESEIRVCTNGILGGSFIYSSCVVQPSLGGGGVRLRKDKCPNGDFSDSYYDGKCGAPDNDNIHNSAVETSYDTLRFDPHYSDEMNKAYQYAYNNGITTRETIGKADMWGKMTRIAMAKMLSQYAINVLGKEPDANKAVSFSDVSSKLDAQYNYGVTLAYQLGIMGINMKNDEFRPYDIVTRAEFVTALSRLLYNTTNGKILYYSTHMNLLQDLGIITNTDPTIQERRGYVMIMLMRSANN